MDDERLREERVDANEAEFSDVLIIGAGISGIGGRVPHPREESGAVLHDSGTTPTDWRYLGPVPLSGHPLRQRHLHAELPLRAVDPAGEHRRRRRHPRISDRYRPQARHRRAHPVQHPVHLGRLGFDDRHLDRADRRGRRAQDLPGPVPVLRHRLLQLRRALHSPSSRASSSSAATWCTRSTGPSRWTMQASGSMVIGSGATAVSMIPSLTEKAAHVTMLQRSPTYMMSMRAVDPMVQAIRKVLPLRAAHVRCQRVQHRVDPWLTYVVAQKAPRFSKWLIRSGAKRDLPEGYPVDVHFKPRYNPWDQRLCLILDNDSTTTIGEGRPTWSPTTSTTSTHRHRAAIW